MIRAIALTLHGLKSVPSETIHGQGPCEDRYTITSFLFSLMLQELTHHASCTISASLEESSGDVVILTFDDGLISDYDQAFPALLDTGLKATFFVTFENIGQPGYMNLGQIREMADHGMEIGSHGLFHRYLVTLPESVARQEISNSRERLQQQLGLRVLAYAPVGGHYAHWMLEAAREAGYSAFATMVPGRTLIRPGEGFQLFRRNHIQSHHDMAYVASVIQGEIAVLFSNVARYQLLAFAKRLLGMENYDRLKSIFIGEK